ncbi:MAG: inositol-3-phosphate synthase [Candidatus Bathyarchaeia archaeon]
MTEIRVAIAGVGNCASALVQGIEYYRRLPETEDSPGVMHPVLADYSVSDITFVAAFDVDGRKLGRDLAESIFVPPNVCTKFSEVPPLGVSVQAAPVLDGVASHMMKPFSVYDEKAVRPVDVANVLSECGADMLLNYLPVGSTTATRYYAEACLRAKCAFVNCIPEFIASSEDWAEKFRQARIPVAGDDIKSQYGATILHRALASLCLDRGIRVDETYQMNLGGNTDFLNMTVEDRLASKRKSKTEAVTSLLPYKVPTRIGPSDYVSFLGDTKVCYIHLKGTNFGGRPISIDLKLSVEDSPNSAGVVVDIIRAVKVALDRKIGGPLVSISSYAFKHPPLTVSDEIAKRGVEEFICGSRDI